MHAEIFRNLFLSTDVLCLKCYRDYLLAGIGNWLFAYKTQDLKFKTKIFNEERIHGIYLCKDFIILKGGKKLSFININEESNKLKCQFLYKINCKDWVQDLLSVKNEQLILATAHNVIEVWDIKLNSCIQTFTCKEKCILYSSRFAGNSYEEFVLLCGTVFSEVIIWAPSELPEVDQPVFHRLKGHTGVIFSITVDLSRNVICTTSDDRSLRIWSVTGEKPMSTRKSWKEAYINVIHTLYGHTARVWTSLTSSDFIISAGEDSRLCFWNWKGKLEYSEAVHQDSGIRGLTSSSSGFVFTGGEDGGITCLTLNGLRSRTTTSPSCYPLENRPRRVAFMREGIVCMTDCGSILMLDGGPSTKVIHHNDELSKYCVLETSSCKRYLMLGSIRGQIMVIRPESCSVIYREALIEGKIFSIHWLEDHVVVCGSGGSMFLYKVQENPIRLCKTKNLVLPPSKERWTTSALLHRGCLILGDRMGSLHVYHVESTSEHPDQVFSKVHGHLGVTDIALVGDVVLTAGRDGTVKEFRFAQRGLVHTLTHKLPMEWGWRMIRLSADILVLGFSSVLFTVWSLKKREMLSTYDCGGGHRSFDCFMTNDHHLSILFIKDKKVYSSELYLNSSFWVRSGFHAREVNSLKILQTNPLIVVSGGEDTTVRISRISNDGLDSLHLLESHISSVRDLAVYYVDEARRIVFSVGGRAQIVVHEFNLETMECKTRAIQHLQRSEGKSGEPSPDGETRMMCVESISEGDDVLVCVGCSDCRIRIFSYESDLKLLVTLEYSHCILRIKCFRSNLLLIAATAGTDGRVVFWDVTDARRECVPNEIASIKIHQSGINSLEVEQLTDGKFLLATGGDDNLLSLILVDAARDFKVLDQWKNSKTHSCQITGIKVWRNALLTSAVDQRLTIWRWSIDRNVISVEFISQYLTTVADVHGMDVSQGENCSLMTCLYGKGLEVIQVNLSELNSDEVVIDPGFKMQGKGIFEAFSVKSFRLSGSIQSILHGFVMQYGVNRPKCGKGHFSLIGSLLSDCF